MKHISDSLTEERLHVYQMLQYGVFVLGGMVISYWVARVYKNKNEENCKRLVEELKVRDE